MGLFAEAQSRGPNGLEWNFQGEEEETNTNALTGK
jgi:hypothetical protein